MLRVAMTYEATRYLRWESVKELQTAITRNVNVEFRLCFTFLHSFARVRNVRNVRWATEVSSILEVGRA